MVAAERLRHALETRYDPSQPRHPAGTSEGGRWSGESQAQLTAMPEPLPRQEEDGHHSGLLAAPDGTLIAGVDGEPVHYPNALPPEFFVEEGRRVSNWMERSLDDERIDPIGVSASLLSLYDGMSSFRIAGPWDAQRINPVYTAEYRDYSTIAIGIYFAAAGIDVNLCLIVQNTYAAVKSKFADTDNFDAMFRYLPKRNVRNTRLGYDIYETYYATRR